MNLYCSIFLSPFYANCKNCGQLAQTKPVRQYDTELIRVRAVRDPLHERELAEAGQRVIGKKDVVVVERDRWNGQHSEAQKPEHLERNIRIECSRKQADRLTCEAWNKRMLASKGPAQPSPALGDELNAGYCYLEVRCLGCDTNQTVPLDIVSLGEWKTPFWVGEENKGDMRRLGLEAHAAINRHDFGVSWQDELPGGGVVVSNEIELAPTPDAAYTIEMVYRQLIPPLATNATNWLLAAAPDLYLYGALLEAAPYIKEDARIQTWGLGLTNALGDLNTLGLTSTFNAGPMTMRVSGQVV